MLLRWKAVGGVGAYAIYRDGKRVGASPGPAWTDNGLKDGTAYRYAVAALGGEGEARSAEVAATTRPDRTAPALVGAL